MTDIIFPDLNQRKKNDDASSYNAKSPLLSEQAREMLVHKMRIGDGITSDEPGAICADLQCNEPTLPCYITKRPIGAWSTSYALSVIIQAVANNTLISFVLAFSTIALMPSGAAAAFIPILIYAFANAAIRFFGLLAFSPNTSAHGEGLTSFVMWGVFAFSNSNNAMMKPWPELGKMVVFWLFQVGGRFLGVILASLAFRPLAVGFGYGAPVLGTLLGNPGLPTLNMGQGIALEALATIVQIMSFVIAHTTPYIRKSLVTTSLFISTSFFASRLLFGWYTGAYGDFLYFLVTGIYNWDLTNWQVYILGPLIGAAIVFVFFLLYAYAKRAICKDNKGCPPNFMEVTPELEETYRQQGRAEVMDNLRAQNVSLPENMQMNGSAGTNNAGVNSRVWSV